MTKSKAIPQTRHFTLFTPFPSPLLHSEEELAEKRAASLSQDDRRFSGKNDIGINLVEGNQMPYDAIMYRCIQMIADDYRCTLCGVICIGPRAYLEWHLNHFVRVFLSGAHGCNQRIKCTPIAGLVLRSLHSILFLIFHVAPRAIEHIYT